MSYAKSIAFILSLSLIWVSCASAEEIITEYSFESGTQGWTNPDGSFGWQRDSGGTPSSSTGPSIDASGSSSGYYVYMETSNGGGPYTAGTESYWVSPSIAWENSELEFSYHMYGSSMGTLYLEVSTNSGSSWATEWSISGQQHSSSTQAYATARVDLTAYAGQTLQLRFRGRSTLTDYSSDMAIDSVKVIRVGPPELTIVAGEEFLEGSSSVPATLTVSSIPDADLEVGLLADTFISVPSEVTILAGETSVDFSFSIEDDADAQGDRPAAITATAPSYTAGIHNLTVYDDESPYTVTFDLDGKGSLSSGDLVQQVVWGQSANAPAVTGNSDWHFGSWDSDFSSVSSDMTVKAQYLPIHTVTFDLGTQGTRTGGGSLTQQIVDGNPAAEPSFDVAEGWYFSGWDHGFSSVTDDWIITAQYIQIHAVTFDLDGKGLWIGGGELTQEVVEGMSAVPPIFSVTEGWRFSGWSHSYNRVQASFIVSAQYEPSSLVATLEEGKVLASDGSGGFDFGSAVSICGDLAVVGAPGDGELAFQSGAVYVYALVGGIWTEQMKLLASDGAEGDNFGASVCLYADTLMVGAPEDDHGSSSGSVYVFRHIDGIWSESEKLSNNTSSRLGRCVSISGDSAVIGSGGYRAYAYENIEGSWVEQAILTASDEPTNSSFGKSVSIFDETIVVGAARNLNVENDTGSAYVYERINGVWTEVAKLLGSAAYANDLFGASVAVSNDTILISAIGNYYTYVFERMNGSWVEQTSFSASDGAYDDSFGRSIVLSGEIAIIGAPMDDPSGSYSGSAYIFERDHEGNWNELGKLIAGDGQRQDFFGHSVSISGDRVILGAYGDDDLGSDSGSAYIFDIAVPPLEVVFSLGQHGTRSGGGELQQSVIYGTSAIAPELEVSEGWYFHSWDVDFSEVTEELTVIAQYVPAYEVTFDLGDYGTLLTGELTCLVGEGYSAIAPEIDVLDGWSFVGWDFALDDVSESLTVSAQYEPSNLVATVQRAKLLPVDAEENDYFGWVLSISGDLAVVGAAYDDDQYDDEGSVYIYVRDGEDWIQEAKLLAPEPREDYYFGSEVSISGNTLAVSAQGGYNTGHARDVYVYVRNDGVWTKQAELSGGDGYGSSLSLDGNTLVVGSTYSVYVYERVGNIWIFQTEVSPFRISVNDDFGESISLSSDTFVVGASRNDGNVDSSGSVYVYKRDNGVWSQEAKLIASDGADGDYFGSAVSLSGDILVVSASGDDDLRFNSGSAYLFTRTDGVWTQETKWTASDEEVSHSFGYSVSVSGEVVAIGDPEANEVYIYKRVGTSWVELKVLSFSHVDVDSFGVSVSLSGDMLLVGDRFDDELTEDNGAAYIYDIGVPPVTASFTLGEQSTRTGGGELTQVIPYGSTPVPVEFEVVSGWVFWGWDIELRNLTRNENATAIYVPEYQLTFDLADHGSLISGELVQFVGEGLSAKAPEIMAADGWAFAGWDRSYHDVDESYTIVAQYSPSDLVGVLEEQKLGAVGLDRYSRLGYSVSLSGGVAAVGSPHGRNPGKVYVYEKNDEGWSQRAVLTAADRVYGIDHFGYSVSACGDTIAVGAHGDDELGSVSGSVYVFKRKDGEWVQEAKLTASDGEQYSYFGYAVSLSGDTLAIGANHSDHSFFESGSVYVFTRNGGMWIEEALLMSEEGSSLHGMGSSLSLSGDTIVTGGVNNGEDEKGQVYVFSKDNDQWELDTILRGSSGGVAGDHYGDQVSVDDNTITVSAAGEGNGVIYVYARTADSWEQQQKILQSGGRISLKGNTLVVGKPFDIVDGVYRGNADVYVRNSGVWALEETLTPTDGSDNDYFGSSVSVSGDTVVVGAFGDDSSGSSYYTYGSAYVFDLSAEPAAVTFFLDGKGSSAGGGELSQLVKVNTAASAPAVTPNIGWFFNAWDTDFSSVTEDLTVKGLFSYDDSTDDGDIMTDGWELVHFGGTNVTDGTIDSDGDGDLDGEEFKSGTDPMDRSDYFRVLEEAVSPVDGKITLRFNTNDDVANRRYRICYTDDLSTTNPWPELPMGAFAPDPGDYTEKTFDYPGSEDAYFFKVEAFIEE